jgi:hypothetical protein
MHPIELLIHKFLQEVQKGNYKIPIALLDKFTESTRAHLVRQFEREPNKFSLRMSNLGRPLCQLECEQAGIKGQSWDNNTLTRNTFGDICEDVLMFILHASGVPIVSEQEQVSLDIAGQKIQGTLDVVIDFSAKCDNCISYLGKCPYCGSIRDPRVWDIKSASDWAFKNKFTLSFDKFLEEDTFGYVDQLFLYGEARGCKVGGFIVQNKSTGEVAIIAFPEEQRLLREAALRRVEEKVNLLSRKSSSIINLQSKISNNSSDQSTFSKSDDPKPTVPTTKFEPIAEYFRKLPTGNMVAPIKCSICDYKFHCWPTLQLKPKAKSEAKNPVMTWYVEYHE